MNDFSAFSSRATIADVAARAGVSTATVSRVMNGTGPVSEQTADRVWAAIADLNYAPHSGAREMAAVSRPKTLGLILPTAGGYFFSEMLQGIESAVGGHDLLIHVTNAPAGEREAFFLPLNEHNTAGLLVFANSLSVEAIRALHERSLPMVLLHCTPPPDLALPSVVFENMAGARRVVEHLIDVHGCRRIAFLAGPEEVEDAGLRFDGYRQALTGRRLVYDEAFVGQGGYDDRLAETAVSRWLAEGKQFDAIFAADDASAVGALTALRKAGRRVPEDVALVGFDDAPLSRHLSPPLTTVRAPIAAAGAAAAEQLLQLIETGQRCGQMTLATEIVIRRSCGCED
ncbi:MAG: LacI family DNA-binding transcriptional regulator [Candidatus Promineifilaceae bacterium]